MSEVMTTSGAEKNSPCTTSKENCSDKILELFLRIYALKCKESAIEMNPRVLQAAVEMQKSTVPIKNRTTHEGVSLNHSDKIEVSYTLTGMSLGVSGIKALIAALIALPITILDLSGCYLGDSGFAALADAVSTSSSSLLLRSLNLSAVGATDAGPLANLVTSSQQLQVLDLSCNKLGTRSAGLAVLCGAMQYHTALREVFLSDNFINGGCDTTMRAIAEWLVCSGRTGVLLHIDLRFNTLGFSRDLAASAGVVRMTRCVYGTHPLVDGLMFNNILEYLDLEGNAFPEDVLDVIDAKLAVNRRSKESIRRELKVSIAA
ncbi:leucine rich repeat containing 45 [Trypanosoma theileri]|uniref:Leucine rich repeat containing 45 n=1 Tax=Trypanosoma theileri TaxID=67003 RepID=A0A1X0NPE3_9TRYP|nr:leucine rich repeat containing 45 [Trypanosoma theileri]ORC86398.1 leucine rich repeat containing 45 [Trypanosoma theileri]